jgi:hypothetical protein
VSTPAPTTKPNTGARRIGIAIAALIGAVIALNLIAGGVDRAVGGNEPSGVTGSSYGTQSSGLAAMATLLANFGHPVARERGALSQATIDPTATLFVIEPESLTDADAATLLDFATAGGRVVIGGSYPFYLHRLRDRPPVWSAHVSAGLNGGAAIYSEVDPRLGNIRQVETAGQGEWTDAGSGTVLAHAGDAGLLTFERVGRGAIFFLADASPLENSYLARADNAAFALGLAGDAPCPVAFAEGAHGYGARRGLGAVPTPWKIALAVCAAAVLALAWSRSRRFGPPDRPARELPPARAEYVRALAVSLERTRDPGRALAPMQQWARSRVALRAHLRPDASLEDIDRAAIQLGFSEAERAAIWHPATDDEAAMALGRMVSHLSQHDGRTP